VAVFIKDDIPEASKNAIVGEMKSTDRFFLYHFFEIFIFLNVIVMLFMLRVEIIELIQT
jgi:hypothetical protein